MRRAGAAISSLTSSKGRGAAGLYSRIRAAISVLGPISMASVLRLPWIDSGENSACTNLALPLAMRLRLRARDERRDFDLQVERLRGAGQAVGLLVHEVLELIRRRRRISAPPAARFMSVSICALTSSNGCTWAGLTPFTLMMCQPNSVCTGPTMSPAFAAKAASSNAFTIVPRGNVPRSPPCCAEPGSFENSRARSPNFAGIGAGLGEQLLGLLPGRGAIGVAGVRLHGDEHVRHRALLGASSTASCWCRTASSPPRHRPSLPPASASAVRIRYSILASSGVWNAAWFLS